jgi:hypothetical protein
MVKVKVPNSQYQGVIAEVQFNQGIGEFKDEKLAEKIAKQFGFEVIKEDRPEKVEKPEKEKPAAEPKKATRKRTKKASE